MSGKLIVSVSGIRERTLDDVAQFCEKMDARSVPVSLLVAPRLKGGYRLDHDPVTVEWLTGRRATGDAILLNGYDDIDYLLSMKEEIAAFEKKTPIPNTI